MRAERTQEERRRAAVFDEWVTNGRFSHTRLASFQAACDRGEIAGLGPKDFERSESAEPEPHEVNA